MLQHSPGLAAKVLAVSQPRIKFSQTICVPNACMEYVGVHLAAREAFGRILRPQRRVYELAHRQRMADLQDSKGSCGVCRNHKH
jgi:hypothetical protein